MKKIISICAVCLVLLPCLFGCAPIEDKEAIVGTWEYRFNDTHAAYYQKYIFEKNGEGTFQQVHATGPMQGEFTYQVGENGNLTLTNSSGWQFEGTYMLMKILRF